MISEQILLLRPLEYIHNDVLVYKYIVHLQDPFLEVSCYVLYNNYNKLRIFLESKSCAQSPLHLLP